MCARRLASPLLLRASRASGSLVDWWVALLRFSPLKSASGLRVPSSGGSPPSFLDKGLVRGPGVDQRAIDAEMLVAGVLGPCGQRLDALEEQPRYILVEQAVTVLAEGRVIPHALVHRQADEPAKQQVEINLLDQLPLGANGVNHLQQRGAQQPLRRNRGPSQGGVQPVEVPIHRSQNGIDQASQGTQRVIVRDALLQRRITEQLVLFEVESTHRLGLASAEEDGRHFARATRALAFFNGLLVEGD